MYYLFLWRLKLFGRVWHVHECYLTRARKIYNIGHKQFIIDRDKKGHIKKTKYYYIYEWKKTY